MTLVEGPDLRDIRVFSFDGLKSLEWPYLDTMIEISPQFPLHLTGFQLCDFSVFSSEFTNYL